MNVALLARRRKDRKVFSFLALTGENVLALSLVATLFSHLFLVRADFLQRTLLPGLGVGSALACLISAAFARRRGRVLGSGSAGSAPCALPVGPNRWFLALLCLSSWIPSFHQGYSGIDLWRIGCALTVIFGLAQIGAAFIAKSLTWIMESASLAGLMGSLALGLLLAGPLPAIVENPHIAVPVIGVMLLPTLARLPLPFGLSSPIAALGVGSLLAWGTGQLNFDLPLWTLPAPVAAASAGFAEIWTFHSELPGWFWAGVLLAVHSAILDVAQLERATRSGDPYDKRSFMLGLGIANVVGGLLGSCAPCAILLGHRVYKKLGGGSVYVQATGLTLLALSLSGLLPLILAVLPEAAWAPLLAWILLNVCAGELEFSTKSSPLAAVCAMLPILGTVFWLSSQGWVGSEPGFSMLAAKRTVLQPWMHTLGIASLARGAIATSLLWGTLAACSQSGMMGHLRMEAQSAGEQKTSAAKDRRRRPRGGPLPHGFREAVQRLDKASWVAFVACLLSIAGLIHSAEPGWNLEPLSATYLMMAIVCHWGYVVELEKLNGISRRARTPLPRPDLDELENSIENPDTSP